MFNLVGIANENSKDQLIDNIYLYDKDLNEPKHQFLIQKREDVGIKHLNDPETFIEYSAYMDDVFNNIDDYHPNRKTKILVVFDDKNAVIMANKKISKHN